MEYTKKKLSRPPAITFHSFPWSLSRCVFSAPKTTFLGSFSLYLRLCCLSPPAKFLKVSHASWVFNEFSLCGPRISAHSACFSFTFDVVMHRSALHAELQVCACVHLQFVLTVPNRIFRTFDAPTTPTAPIVHTTARTSFRCVSYLALYCIVSSICCAFRRAGWRVADADEETQWEVEEVSLCTCQFLCEIQTYIFYGRKVCQFPLVIFRIFKAFICKVYTWNIYLM